jgi:hypothetical protein
MIASVAEYTPSAALRMFERGELRVATILVLLVLGVADGWLSADGNVIYRASDLKVGLFKQDEALQPSGA